MIKAYCLVEELFGMENWEGNGKWLPVVVGCKNWVWAWVRALEDSKPEWVSLTTSRIFRAMDESTEIDQAFLALLQMPEPVPPPSPEELAESYPGCDSPGDF